MTGTILVLTIGLGFVVAKRRGFTPFHTLRAAMAGDVTLA